MAQKIRTKLEKRKRELEDLLMKVDHSGLFGGGYSWIYDELDEIDQILNEAE